MNEMTLNGNSMYDEVTEISKLNQVEGFDPRRFMRLIPPPRYWYWCLPSLSTPSTTAQGTST